MAPVDEVFGRVCALAVYSEGKSLNLGAVSSHLQNRLVSARPTLQSCCETTSTESMLKRFVKNYKL